MDPLQLLADLEGLRDKIPDAFRADYEDLITTIRNIYEASIKFITPPQPVQDGKINLASHHTTVDDLHIQLQNSLSSFQSVYVGKGSNAYHTTAFASVQNLQLISDHLATASQLHSTMEFQFNLATEEQIALVSLIAGLGITLGVLIFSAGTTAPVTIPAAALEAAGGAVSIGLMTEAEAAAAAAIMALLWAELPSALLTGLIAIGSSELIGNIMLHPITFNNAVNSNTTASSSTNSDPTVTKLYSTIKTTPDGRQIRVRELKPKEVNRLRAQWGQGFHGAKGGKYKATDIIYEDQDGEYWIGNSNSDNVEAFP